MALSGSNYTVKGQQQYIYEDSLLSDETEQPIRHKLDDHFRNAMYLMQAEGRGLRWSGYQHLIRHVPRIWKKM